MTDTPNLALPYIFAAQAQKHVTHNEAIRALDCLVQLSVADRNLAAPPGAPVEGDRYLVAAGATGAWAGQSGRVAAFQDGAWAFYVPRDGWIAWVADENVALVYDGGAWSPLISGAIAASMLGINGATADSTNRLAISAPATLFNHEGNGHQAKINKNAAGDTASYLFQTGFSGRAEVGLTGDDDFHFKVSPDGSAWVDAMKIDKTTGLVTHVDGVMPRTLSVQNGGDMNDSASGSGSYFVHNLNYVLPANFLKAGRALRVTVHLLFTTGSGPPAYDFELRAGSTVLAHVTPGGTFASNVNNQGGLQWIIQGTQAPGASANVLIGSLGNSNLLSNVNAHSDTDNPVAVATNGALTLQFASKWASAGVGPNQITLKQLIVEALN